MTYEYREKRYAADKLVLLGLFIGSLMVAKAIVAHKSAIKLIPPIALEYSGLAVPMPSGNGWKAEASWTRRDNDFLLRSFFAPTAPRPSIQIRCRYLLAAPPGSVAFQLTFKAGEHPGQTGRSGQITAGAITTHWIHLETKSPKPDMIFAVIPLPDHRQLNIEVEYIDLEFETAFKAFDELAGNIEFEDNKFLRAGREVVDEIKNSGLNSFFESAPRQGLFLISDISEKPLGFATERILSSGKEPLNIQAQSFIYYRGPNAREQVTFFQGDGRLEEFVWKNQSVGRNGTYDSELTLSEDRTLTLRESTGRLRESAYRLNPAVIPEIFLEQLFSRMVDSGRKEIVVDIIESDGAITPMYFALIQPNQSDTSEQPPAHTLRAGFMHKPDFFEYIYLDEDFRILKRTAQPRRIYTLERQNPGDILRYFPEKAEFILQSNKLIEQNRL